MKKKLVLTLFLGLCLATTINKIRLRYDWPNAIRRTLMTPFTGTVWTEGFSETNFAKVTIGMPLQDVQTLLGNPLYERCGPKGRSDGCEWLYSGQDTSTADFDRRWVSFNALGRVEYIRHDFFID